jgi:hypothetical protein
MRENCWFQAWRSAKGSREFVSRCLVRWRCLSFNEGRITYPEGLDTAMHYSTYLCIALATLPCRDADDTPDPRADPADAMRPALDDLLALVETFRRAPVCPTGVAKFENDLRGKLRELGRVITQSAFASLEPAAVPDLPREVHYESESYRRLAEKTPQEVSTLFGKITVHRLGYRAAPDAGVPVLFPLVRELGIVHGATPALVERVARYLAETGATQGQTLKRLREEHGLAWGVKRLRQVAEFVSAAMERHRADAQADQVLRWLRLAQQSKGRHRPVLGAGRDGITLGLRLGRFTLYEVATTGTISVYDRRGERLGTVYLAYTPEPGQATMTARLTELLTEVLRRWQGPLPRLCYVTDAGDNETAYYRDVLRRMKHPTTGKRLGWTWVLDYYHAALRLTTMAEALFGASREASGWVRKMQKLLLKPGGVGRVLHSAAALRSRRKLSKKARKDYQRAYDYLRKRRDHARYDEYRRVGMPIGSGVTEAACKTVYTQRLKLSGMRWKKAGARTILTLRVILLSGVWPEVYAKTLAVSSRVEVRTPDQSGQFSARIAG